MKDEIIEQFSSRWDEACAYDVKAKILRGFVLYLRQRYRSLEGYNDLIEPKLTELERVVGGLYDPQEFLTVASAIGYIRGKVKERAANYGAGIKPKCEPQRDSKPKRRLPAGAGPGVISPFAAPDNASPDICDRDLESA